MADEDQQTRRREARRRALRAARAVTMGLALTAAGCSNSHGPGEDASMPSDAEADSGFDGVCDDAGVSEDPDCCEMSGGVWSGGACAVPGPFVPPSMDA